MAISMDERAQRQAVGFRVGDAGADARLRELILYIALCCERHARFGATKLNKILYYADFISYARYGEAITGADYMKLPNGPAPVRLVPVRNEMIGRQEIVIREKRFGNIAQHRIIALREPDLRGFKGRDIALVDEVIQALAARTADEVSDLSHGIAWRIADERGLIPYEAILLAEPVVRPQDIEEARQLADKYGWVDA